MSVCIYCNICGKDTRSRLDRYIPGANIPGDWKRITVIGKGIDQDIDICDSCIAKIKDYASENNGESGGEQTFKLLNIITAEIKRL